MSEDEAGKFKKEFDDNAMPGDFDLPEDTTGAMGSGSCLKIKLIF